MDRMISVGELRRNLAGMLDAAIEGATVVVTRHGTPIADLVPHVAPSGISGTELMTRLRAMPSDATWLDDLVAARTADDRDPWGMSGEPRFTLPPN